MVELPPILESVIFTAIRVSSMACSRSDELEETYRSFVLQPQFKRRIPIKGKPNWFTVESGERFLYREHALDFMDDLGDDDDDIDDTLQPIEGDMVSELIFYQLKLDDGPTYFGTSDPLDSVTLTDAHELGMLSSKTWLDVVYVSNGFFLDPDEHILFPSKE